MLRSCAASVTARLRGCSLGCSTLAATHSSSSSVTPSAARQSVRRGLPWVTVPVLSSTTVLTRPISSSDWADLMRMPFSAALPVPTMMATGVARPSAQGQEITSTAIPTDRQNCTLWPPTKAHSSAAMRAMDMTTGTNTPLILSARREMGALLEDASSISFTIWDRVVSAPTRVASSSR